VSIPDSSTRAVDRVVHFDGRTKVVGARKLDGEWRSIDQAVMFDRLTAHRLRAEGYFEVELRRRMRRARIPLSWVVGRLAS
jgi:hypothetical protein